LRYHLRGAVRLTQAGAGGITATVQGTRRYQVALGYDGDALEVSCTCPAFGAGPCKHIWATILRAESSGLLDSRRTGPRGDSPETSETFLAPADLDDAGREFEPGLDLGFPLRGGARSQSRREPWRERLDLAAGARVPEGPLEPPGSQIVYIVDVPATLAGGVLAVEVARRRRTKAGGWGAPGVMRLAQSAIPLLADPADRELLALLGGAQDSPYLFASAMAPSLYRLAHGLDDLLVPRLCASGRCLLRRDSESPLSGLSWDPGEPWELWLEMRAEGAHYAVHGHFRRGAERALLGEPRLLVNRLVFFEDRAARFDHGQAMGLLADLRRHGPIKVPRPYAKDALERLLRRPERPRLELDPELRLEESQGVGVPHLVVKASPNDWTDRLPCLLSFDYAGTLVSADDPSWCVPKTAERRLLIRDRALEEAALARLPPLGFRGGRAGERGTRNLQLPPRHLSRAVRALLSAGWHVEAEGKVYRSAGAVRMEVVSGIDWFDLKGEVEFADGTVPLPAVLAALRRGENTITLGDGALGMLPEEWLKKYGLLASLGSAEAGALRFRRSQAALLDALLAAQPEVAIDSGFAEARDALRAFDGVRPGEQPKGFVGELREYQRQGLGWLSFLDRFGFGGCLADDMGLGKTVQVLALLEGRRSAPRSRERLPSLVVVPRSLVFNWKDEAARFTPRLRILEHIGAERAKDKSAFSAVDVVLTTYGTLRRDMLLLKDVEFDYVVLDEAQAVKNAATVSAKAVRLLKSRRRLALSGTPIENHMGELWSLFEFLNPEMLGRVASFPSGSGSGLDEGERAVLARALRPFILRRTKGEVARDLPPKVEQTVHCELDAPQRKLYDELRRHYRGSLLSRIERDGIGRSKIHVLEALLRLRQAACHPGLIDPKRAGEPSAKIDVLLPRLEEVRAEGHKALVFSQFTSFLAILRSRLDELGFAYEYLDGRTRDRAERVRRFQEESGPGLFLISLKAGGLGLNLTAAEYVFLLDPWWNPAVEAQAIDRTHRIGQSRHVFAYRLIARHTVEEKVLELQEKKRGLADALLGGDKSLIGELRREDLEMLLS
jgi:superfamily II DNA or RNA helicase